MGFVFISYSRSDTAIVDNVVARLRSDGFEIWIDRESIKGGDLWRKQIVKAIHTTDAFVLMLSPNSTASKNVRKEVDLAENANRALFPFLLASVDLPEELQYQLIGIQWIEFYKNPEEKYQELVEVLRAHQKTIFPPPETRRVEAVIPGKSVKKFGRQEQEELLNFMASKAETRRADLRLVNLTAGSVHAFVEMPADAAYTLETAALNRDRDLIEYGIDALRLDGEENFVLVKTGEIGKLNLRPPRSFLPRFLLILIGAGVLLGALFASAIALAPVLNPPTPTPTSTPIPTSTSTLTSTPTQIPTPTSTFTPTPTPNPPPPAPEIVSPYHGLRVVCSRVRSISLDWNEPFDENGIDRYRVVLDTNIDGEWRNILDREIPADVTELDITKEFFSNCGNWLRWRVQARDGAGTWGAWSAEPVFLGEEPVLLFVPVINLPPPAPEIVSPQHLDSVNCFSGSIFLIWQKPEDSDGIAGYEVELYESTNSQWSMIGAFSVGSSISEFDITKEVNTYCGHWLSWRVRAKDGLDAWGGWSSQPMFWTQAVPP